MHNKSTAIVAWSVTDPGHDDSFDVLKDVVPRFRVSRRLVGQQLTQVARLHIGQRPTVPDVLQVIRHVVHHLLPSLPELFRVHHLPDCDARG